VIWKATEHARTVLAERAIESAWVDRVLHDPDRVETDPHDPTLRHALGQVAERQGRVLRVVYRDDGEVWHVVTAFFDRREIRRS